MSLASAASKKTLLAGWRQRLVAKRFPAQQLTISRRNRLYILPSRSGLLALLFAGLLLLLAVNYSNSLIYLLLFWLMAVGLLSMVQTQRNCLDLQISAAPPKPVFAGTAAQLPLRLAGQRQHFAIELCALDAAVKPLLPLTCQLPLLTAAATAHLNVTLPPLPRGHWPVPRLRLSSRYPLGLFRCWSYVTTQQSLWVYPAAMANVSLPSTALVAAQGQQNMAELQGNDEFYQLRDYIAGDHPSQIAWRAVARRPAEKLLSREFSGEQGAELLLSWSAAQHWLQSMQQPLPASHSSASNDERCLSLLCAWALQAEQQGRAYQLQLPEQQVDLGSGALHLEKCLQALALHGHAGASDASAAAERSSPHAAAARPNNGPA